MTTAGHSDRLRRLLETSIAISSELSLAALERERVALLDGRVTVESSAGSGTTLAVEVPVS
jgi:signal transduction histidine kinase